MSEFVEYLKEVFEPFGQIHARRMFGGYGLYYNGIMIGLVADDTLYLKADEDTVAFFRDKDLGPFEYNKAGKTVRMSYYLAPEEIFDDPGEATLWARRAWEAACRAKKTGRK